MNQLSRQQLRYTPQGSIMATMHARSELLKDEPSQKPTETTLLNAYYDSSGFIYPEELQNGNNRLRVAVTRSGFVYAEKWPRSEQNQPVLIVGRLDITGLTGDASIDLLNLRGATTTTELAMAIAAIVENPPEPGEHQGEKPFKQQQADQAEEPQHEEPEQRPATSSETKPQANPITAAWDNVRQQRHLGHLDIDRIVRAVAQETADLSEKSLTGESGTVDLGKGFSITCQAHLETPKGTLTQGFVIAKETTGRKSTAVIGAAPAEGGDPPALRDISDPHTLLPWNGGHGNQETWLKTQLRNNVAQFITANA